MTLESSSTPMSSTLDEAINLAKHGYRIIPIKPGQKHPGMNSWQTHATTDFEIIRNWYTGLYAGYGIGIAPGPFGEQHLFVLDIDEHGISGSDTLHELEDSYGNLPPTVTTLTGNGGQHLYFLAPHEIRNDQAAKVGPGIDIRGTGGQVLAPPTIHPNGQPYRWAIGFSPDEIQPAEAPRWLLALITPKPAPEPVRSENRGIWDEIDDSPAAQYNRDTNWIDLLQADGWTLERTDRTGEQHWIRPGKQTGTSATVGWQGKDILKVFTSSLEWLPEGAYTRFGYTACRHHNGDRSAFAKTLTKQPHITPPVMQAAAPDDDWQPPTPITHTHQPPEFPTHVLPTWITNHTQQIADDIQVAHDLPANLALAALSIIALGNTTITYPRQRWTQPLNIYTAIALPPSAGKTPAKNAIFKPLEEYEHERMAEARAAHKQYESESRMLDKRLKDYEDKEARATGPTDEIRANKHQTILDIANLTKPSQGRLLVDDTTTEALGQTLADNNGSIALVSAEGGLFDRIAGMYNDGTANLDLYLEAWSGGRYVVDRIKRESIQIPSANLVIATTIQPQTLDEIGARKNFAGRGLTARFLLTTPHTNVGIRDRLKETIGDPQTEQHYHNTILTLARRHHNTRHELTISPEASHHYAQWDQHLENQLAPGQPYEHLAEWIGKLRANTLRIAGLLHIAWHQPDTTINLQTMQDAIELGNYYLTHMTIITDQWGTDETTAKTLKLARWIERTNPEPFTIRDLMRKHRRTLTTADETIPILHQLIEHGYIRPLFDGPILGGQRRGKTPQLFQPNPLACDGRQMSPLSPEQMSRMSPNVTTVIHSPEMSQPVDKPPQMSRMSRMSPKGGIEHSLSLEIKNSEPPTPGDKRDKRDISHDLGNLF